MFGKNDKISKRSVVQAAGSPSILSSSAIVTGRIDIEEDLRIDGRMEGDIRSKGKVVIGPDGYVKGNIESGSVELTGKMSGDVTVSDIVILRACSYYEGQVTARKIEIEAGARFYGNCKMEESIENDGSGNIRPADTPVPVSGEENLIE